jgi:preprotein translocase subunit SecA
MQNVQTSSSENGGTTPASSVARGASAGAATRVVAPGAAAPTKQGTIVKRADDWSTTPRNAPCPCGSGKKYKHCHGKVS